MGLFNFIKTKRTPLESLMSVKGMTEAVANAEWEAFKKQVDNLYAVGRDDDVEKAWEEYLDKYDNTSSKNRLSDADVARISYVLAYFYLPNLVYDNWDEFIKLWEDNIPFEIHLAIKGPSIFNWICASGGKEEYRLTLSQIKGFKGDWGYLIEDVEYFLFEFPPPPPPPSSAILDQFETEAKQGKRSPEDRPVLAPYYIVILQTLSTGGRQIYILGQSPNSGTTIRIVGKDPNIIVKKGSWPFDYLNISCGPGPAPTRNNFLDTIRSIRESLLKCD